MIARHPVSLFDIALPGSIVFRPDGKPMRYHPDMGSGVSKRHSKPLLKPVTAEETGCVFAAPSPEYLKTRRSLKNERS